MKLTTINFNTTCRVVRASRSSVQKVGKVQTQLQKKKSNLRNTRKGLNFMKESLRYTERWGDKSAYSLGSSFPLCHSRANREIIATKEDGEH